MNDRAPNGWGSIPDWIQVFFVVLTPLFGVLLEVWVEWDSPWTIFAAAFLALISSLVLVAAFGRLRAAPIRTFTQALKARIFSESRQGVVNRLLLGLGAGGILLFVVWRADKQTQYWWLAIGASVAAWLALSIVSLNITVRRLHADLNDALSSLRMESNASLDKLRAEHSDLHRGLQELAKDVTNLEGAVWSYPDGDSDWIPRYDFLIRLDMPTEVIEMSGPRSTNLLPSMERAMRFSALHANLRSLVRLYSHSTQASRMLGPLQAVRCKEAASFQMGEIESDSKSMPMGVVCSGKLGTHSSGVFTRCYCRRYHQLLHMGTKSSFVLTRSVSRDGTGLCGANRG
jgi:hypothetical protein